MLSEKTHYYVKNSKQYIDKLDALRSADKKTAPTEIYVKNIQETSANIKETHNKLTRVREVDIDTLNELLSEDIITQK